MKHHRVLMNNDELKKLYLEDEYSSLMLAKKYNCHHATITKRLKKIGVSVRTCSEAGKIAIAKGRRFLIGEKNPRWTGGRHKTAGGYIKIYQPNHPRARGLGDNYVKEHIIIWEKANKKLLPKDWIIHHLNGVKDDNRPGNLIAIPKVKHHVELVNQALKKRIYDLEEKIKRIKNE